MHLKTLYLTLLFATSFAGFSQTEKEAPDKLLKYLEQKSYASSEKNLDPKSSVIVNSSPFGTIGNCFPDYLGYEFSLTGFRIIVREGKVLDGPCGKKERSKKQFVLSGDFDVSYFKYLTNIQEIHQPIAFDQSPKFNLSFDPGCFEGKSIVLADFSQTFPIFYKLQESSVKNGVDPDNASFLSNQFYFIVNDAEKNLFINAAKALKKRLIDGDNDILK